MKIYVSGKITGLPLQDARLAFMRAEDRLRAKYPGAEIINPMEAVPFCSNKTWKQYMLEDIALLFDCTNIYMIRGWRRSKGARIERFIARVMQKRRVRI